MPDDRLDELRSAVDAAAYADEEETVARLAEEAGLDAAALRDIRARAAELVREIRASSRPGPVEAVLAEYGLSTDAGVALMRLAEALPRVPDSGTVDALIADKIATADWRMHLGRSPSRLVNAFTLGLRMASLLLDDPPSGASGVATRAAAWVARPAIRAAAAVGVRAMGRRFVLGETIGAAMRRARPAEAEGCLHSYDMLGEAAMTADDAARYHEAYRDAVAAVAGACRSDDPRANPAISVKLSALHPRFEEVRRGDSLEIASSRLLELARAAAAANMGLCVDAEEAARLSLSLDAFATALADPSLAGWEGFGVAVQAYGQRAGPVVEWLQALAERHDRRLAVRLVKGAYWDVEIKRAQQAGLESFPVFTRKAATDASYIAVARRLLSAPGRLFPQFATHNAHTAAAILRMAGEGAAFEFQRLHGMGERLHEILAERSGRRCRVYAPVGARRDLLAYLARRLLENGANSSFVNLIADDSVAPETVAADPFESLGAPSQVRAGPDLFLPERGNAQGWDLAHRPALEALEAARTPFRDRGYDAAPLIVDEMRPEPPEERRNPAAPDEAIGTSRSASSADVEAALRAAAPWRATAAERAAILNRAADLLEADRGRLLALLAREAGKTLPDAVAELREAADFLRYYAARAPGPERCPRGVFACISPWNFPLAIFLGQVAGALAAGNGVLAKPAEQTPLIAHAAATLLHRAGVPPASLQFLPGAGETVGATLVADPRVAGAAFTGSTPTALAIRRAMAENLDPGAPLIAETGGLNAMIVDSTALPEQAVRDVVRSAFGSAGQRCSSLRCVYVQEEIADGFMRMLFGAMDALRLGDPWELSTDVGPVIDADAREDVAGHVAAARDSGRILKELPVPERGHFVGPVAIAVGGIGDLAREVFGPALHVATFRGEGMDGILDEIGSSGYGLTFCLHSRIDGRARHVAERLKIGNVYVNRDQIGAVVGSQPFGGEGLSGTGPKAGGPEYLSRFLAEPRPRRIGSTAAGRIGPDALAARLAAAPPSATAPEALDLPGPAGESNRLRRAPREPILCLGPGPEAAEKQRRAVEELGGIAVAVPESAEPGTLTELGGFGGVVWWGDEDAACALARALAAREGPILPLATGEPQPADVLVERHLCVDTAASGGDAELLARSEGGRQ